jgi:hypothetical protein
MRQRKAIFISSEEAVYMLTIIQYLKHYTNFTPHSIIKRNKTQYQ